MILAVLSVLGGAINLPHWIGEGWLDKFLEPVFEHGKVEFTENSGLEFGLMGLTIVLMIGAVGFAWSLYGTQNEKPAQLAERLRPLYTGSLNKWFVDEIYEATIIGPLLTASRQVLWAVVHPDELRGLPHHHRVQVAQDISVFRHPFQAQ